MMKTISFSILILIVLSCSKEDDSTSSNPYNDPANKPPADTTAPLNLDSSSFQFLYYKVFKPTCSNSGCHDGNFQPDFRTLYSSYNTLVNHSVIQNDDQSSFKYRVEPYSLEKSLLYERLTSFMQNTSGIMPLAVEPGSDWNTDSAIYKDLIADWIVRGAPDSYGNLPGSGNVPPQVIGIMVFNSGSVSNPFPRQVGGLSPISVPEGIPVDVWFAFTDDKSDAQNFKMTQVKSSYKLFDFSASTFKPLSNTSAISGPDFWNNTVQFTHKATIDLTGDTIGTYVYLRTYLRDEEQVDTTEIPNSGSSDIMRSYFSLKVDSL